MTGDAYEELADDVEGNFLLRPVGQGHALVLGEDDGLPEAHWLRLPGQAGITFVEWTGGAYPAGREVPTDMKGLHQSLGYKTPAEVSSGGGGRASEQ